MTDRTLIDRPGRVRSGEELDIAAIDAVLKARDPGLEGTPEVRQFSGGASNLTYLLAYPGRELILRRPPFGHKAKSAHDMVREARVMQALRPVYPYVPQIVALCDDTGVMGCDFFVMERIRGIIPRQDLPSGLDLTVEETRRLCLSVIDRLVELHGLDPQASGLDALGRGEGYVRRQIEGWSGRFRAVRLEGGADFEAVMAWLAERMPAGEAAIRAVHNDFRLDNVVLDPTEPTRVIAVLDWEMATLGDPLMDLGNSLAYWVQADDDPTFLALRRQPTHLPGMLTRAEVVEYYHARTGLPVGDMDFYLVYGLFRLAVIVQQIYYRYAKGQTDNPQFARFGDVARYLEHRCRAAIKAAAK
ncbi:phosphotransferase family protein [Xanthobacter versatilis]|uniref:phosphotransferase family protein n=1 Tax=Xanthobacter autotrophicus (strain ATCC BAA-1158 / Py2) TaxID=78245 RepID=UPI003727E179